MKPEDGPWVSLPSKRYPDKVYYFNASTSVSSWERPEHYCEPVDDGTTFQYFARATTPERTENRSYIVESLSPTCSPRKSEDVSKSSAESYGKKDNEKEERISTFHFHEKRNKVNNYPSTNDNKKRQMKDEFMEKDSKNVRDLKINTSYSFPRYSKQAERLNYTLGPTRPSHYPDTWSQKSYISLSKYSPYERLKKLSYGDTSAYENYGQSYSAHSLKDRSDLLFTRDKVTDSKIYGAASLRLERLKKKLADEHERKHQHSPLDRAENSTGSRWQSRLSKQNDTDNGSRYSDISLNVSASPLSRNDHSYSTSKSQVSGIGNVDIFSKAFTSSLSAPSEQLHLSNLPKKQRFNKNSFDLHVCSTDVLPGTNYSSALFETHANDRMIHLPVYQDRPCNKLMSEEYRFSDVNQNVSSKISLFDHVSEGMTTTIGPMKRYDQMSNVKYQMQDVGTTNILPQHKRNLFSKPKQLDVVSMVHNIRQHPASQTLSEDKTHHKTDFLQDSTRSLEIKKDLLSTSQFSSNFNLPTTEQLRPKFMLHQAKTLQKRSVELYDPVPKSNPSAFSKLQSFLGQSEQISRSASLSANTKPQNTEEVYFLSGSKSDLHPSIKTRSDAGHDFNPRRHTFVDDKIPIKTSESLGMSVTLTNEKKKPRNTSLEWNPPELVRDYNHKRIADCNQTTSATFMLDKNTVHAEYATKTFVRNELRKENEVKEKNKKPNVVQQNCNPTHLELFDQYSKYEHLVRSSNVNNKTLRTSRNKNDEHLKQMRKSEHCFGYEKNKCISRERHEVRAITGPQSEKQFMRNTDTKGKLIDIHQNNQSDECKPKHSAKQKLYGSKGGISKISHRVQKQLRTAVPKMVHLPSNLIQKRTKISSLKSEVTSDVSEHQFTDKEEMDWEPIEPEKVVMHMETLRREGSLQSKVNSELINLCSANTTVSSEWFVVLDTNVLLSHLDFLHELLTVKDNELGMPTLFIPWVALQELDSLKSTNRQQALHLHARKAVNFLYHKLVSRHPRVQGQPKVEADEYSNLEPDDSILQCSLNLQKQSNKVLLLTNDHNLCSKGIVSGVESCSAAMLVQELEKRRGSSLNHGLFRSDVNETNPPLDYIIDDTRQCIGMVLEEVLRTEMVLAYDRKWTEIVARKPPWNLDDIIFCLLKHWTAVFHLVLPSAGRELVEKIQCFIKREAYTHSLKTVASFLKTCVSLMHLVSSLCYKQYVDDALNTLHKLQNSLKDQVSSSSKNDVPSQCSASSIYSATCRTDDTDSTTSINAHNTISSRGSVPSTKCEQQPQIGTSTADSRSFSGGDYSNSVVYKSIYDVRKVESDDDCLSLFASSFSEDVNNHSTESNIERGKELSHNHLNKIWEKIAVYCGLLCDVMGMDPCVPYQKPEQFPSLEILHQNMLFYIKCVGSLLHCIEGILAVQPNELHEGCIVLLNFYENIKEALTMWNEPAESLLPQHILTYCTQNDTREQLKCGRNQFQQFENILNQAVKFFLAQNKSTEF